MSRFDRLEFDRPKLHTQADAPTEQQLQSRHAVRDELHDEKYWLKAASNERRAGLHESALRNYSRALEMDKSLVDGWIGQVQMLIALEEYPEAELWSRKALELFKNNAELLAARCQALCRTGDLKNAQASGDAAIAQPGLFSYPWVARGELMLACRENIDDYCFDKATQLDGDWLVTLEIGAIYLHYGKAIKALQRTRVAVEKAPEQVYCWYRQGICEVALGLIAAAEKSFSRCLELRPGDPLARRELDEIRGNRGYVAGWFRRLFRFS
jgi:tetratricopeptide (TPR) repeat protein